MLHQGARFVHHRTSPATSVQIEGRHNSNFFGAIARGAAGFDLHNLLQMGRLPRHPQAAKLTAGCSAISVALLHSSDPLAARRPTALHILQAKKMLIQTEIGWQNRAGLVAAGLISESRYWEGQQAVRRVGGGCEAYNTSRVLAASTRCAVGWIREHTSWARASI
jgi:hypothetical protein